VDAGLGYLVETAPADMSDQPEDQGDQADDSNEQPEE
jgi:hypothetical protein